MARWQPDAPERLVLAALDLFEEHGYEHTTVIQIAQRAGLTKSTFFRHFPDKREVLFGGDQLATLLLQEVTTAPAGAAPLHAIAHAFDVLAERAFTPARRAFTARRRAVIATAPELQEREALKGIALTAAMAEGLQQRGVPDLTSRAAAQLGALALAIAYERWSGATGGEGVGDDPGDGLGEGFGDVARRALAEVQAAAAGLDVQAPQAAGTATAHAGSG